MHIVILLRENGEVDRFSCDTQEESIENAKKYAKKRIFPFVCTQDTPDRSVWYFTDFVWADYF